MKILQVHNYYQQSGGEDRVVRAERELLEARGNVVITHTRNNDEIRSYNWWRKIRLGVETTWSRSSYRELRSLVRAERPDVAHFHNIFPLLSPASLCACRDAGVPVVWTIHNFRLMCSAAVLRRGDAACERCVGRLPWPALLHRCYHGSWPQTSVVAGMIGVHRMLSTFSKCVNVFVALSEFSRAKLTAHSISAESIVTIPNCVSPDPGAGDGAKNTVLFVGRLSPEKGVKTLLQAWGRVGNLHLGLKIVGDGPEDLALKKEAWRLGLSSVEFTGRLTPADTLDELKRAHFLVVPSWHESCSMVTIEAFACGVPVICSDFLSLRELVVDGHNGLHFRTGDAAHLAERIAWAWAHPAEMAAMGRAARLTYERHYTGDRHYEALLLAYRRALGAGAGAAEVKGRQGLVLDNM
jgi:glycosyltransferase involved in cell wall biosynthesis